MSSRVYMRSVVVLLLLLSAEAVVDRASLLHRPVHSRYGCMMKFNLLRVTWCSWSDLWFLFWKFSIYIMYFEWRGVGESDNCYGTLTYLNLGRLDGGHRLGLLIGRSINECLWMYEFYGENVMKNWKYLLYRCAKDFFAIFSVDSKSGWIFRFIKTI